MNLYSPSVLDDDSSILAGIECLYNITEDGSAICKLLTDENGAPTDWILLKVNAAFQAHIGIDKKIQGKKITELLPGILDDRSDWWGIFNGKVNEKKELSFESHIPVLNKSFNIKCRALEGPYFVAIFRDITSQESLAKQLTKKMDELSGVNMEYDLLLSSMTDGITYYNTDGSIEYFNPKALEILSLTADELLGRVSYPKDWTMVREDLSPYPHEKHPAIRTLQTGEAQENIIMGVQVAKNKYKWISISSVAINNKKGQIESVLAVFRDITQLKTQQENIKFSGEHFRFVFANVSDLICIQSADGLYESASFSSKEIIGYEEKQLIGTSLPDYIHPNDLKEVKESYQNALKSKTVSRLAYRFKHKDGHYVWLETIYQPIFHKNGKISKLITSTRNIDESKHIEKQLRNLNEELNRSNQELADFAYVASHDLREPLRMVASFTQLLAIEYRDKLDEQAKKYIDFAANGAIRMQKLIEDLLKYSRINTVEADFEPMDIRVLSDLAVHIYSDKLAKTDAQLINNIPSQQLLVIPSLIERVFQNLIDNAIKFRHSDRKLTIELNGKCTEHDIIISVSDNGIGIKTEFYNKIFKIFQRLHNNEDYQGTGMGLAISKLIFEKHNGKIWVDSTPEMGSTFYFSLPLPKKKTT